MSGCPLRMLVPSTPRKPLVVGRVVHDVQEDHLAKVEGVEPTVKGREVNTVQVRRSVAFPEVSGNPFWGNHLPPLTIFPDAGEAGLKGLPDGRRRLASLPRLSLQDTVGFLPFGVDSYRGGAERQVDPSDLPTKD